MDIEEDIKILEKFKNNEMQRDKLERDSRCGGWKIGDIYKKLELNIAIDHILAEREEDKKKIDKLQVLEDDLKDKRIVYVDTPEFEEKFIAKQKVYEEIENLKLSGGSDGKDNIENLARELAIEICKELLEDK